MEREVEKLKLEVGRLKKELKKKKKYGLVWEEKPEEVVEMCKAKLPVLKEVKSKEIITDKDKPMNLLIEGDNYHALSVLNYTHKGKIDLIYIDPPYNTGAKDWLYNNSFIDNEDPFRHSKWLSFMHSRLKLAKNLLSQNGILAVAIDHYELFSLGLMVDEIFGEDNRLAIVTVVHKAEGRQFVKGFNPTCEYVLFYAKDKTKCTVNMVPLDSGVQASFDLEDEYGKYRLENNIRLGGGSVSLRVNNPTSWYPIYVSKDCKIISLEKHSGSISVYPITKKGEERTWNTSKGTFQTNLENGQFVAKNEDGCYVIYRKYREKQSIKTHWIKPQYNATRYGTQLLNSILGSNTFNFPKSLFAIIDILKIATSPKSTVLDFFAGSGTTGHAVFEMNKEDEGQRQFILCTNNENKICEEVTYPRIEKVIKGYKNTKIENIAGLGGNLKYFKTELVDAESNDRNKIKLTKEVTEMLCIKEETFEMVKGDEDFKIFKNTKYYTGIIFDQSAIEDFKKAIKDIKGSISVYVFSLTDEDFSEDFEDVKQKIKISPIPEAILRVYRRIFK
ncbi:MAG: hypothetical protein UR22_C0013G0020 [Parcubacteria group bacterium GW2011_GWC2_32_10]|nr:MAG: hypothetical protein UR22_C0013G0020 [Parcubacteria group bacterium GW2011_GWC2_32_10]